MPDVTFDRARFAGRLATRRLGRHLVVRDTVESTNDDAWDALAQGAPDGAVVIAQSQTRGRGRLGRVWITSPGRGLAMSLVLHLGCDPDPLATLPLVAGLALASALDQLGVRDAQLKWPNDLLLGGRKLAGILCERRRGASGLDAAVVGVGVNVAQTLDEFPPELRDVATSLALAGHAVTREDVAAGFLNAFEPLWTEHAEGDRTRAIAAWRARASFWGAVVTVHTPAGPVGGIARSLDDDGALRVETKAGTVVRVIAGDLEIEGMELPRPSGPAS